MHFLFKHLFGVAHFLQLIVHAAVVDPKQDCCYGENSSGRDPKRIPPAGASGARGNSRARSGGFRRSSFRANFSEEIFARVRRRSLRRRSESEKRDAAMGLGELARAFRTGGEMRAQRLRLFGRENAESQKLEIFFADVLIAQVNSRFKVSTAVRIQVFIVPRGAPVRPAISL